MSEDDCRNIKGFFAVGQRETLEDYCTHHGLSVDRIEKFISKRLPLKLARRDHIESSSGLSRVQKSELADKAVDELFSEEEKKRVRRNELRQQRRARDIAKDDQN